ncbi:MBOAT family O-acyltransferase [Zavarzinia sp. CC-PAN008]|uniref:MBOAT family O-acyltransferase n=1 Tax=Zavarzinia sp. CC-PAN008 TaxID=3243332 RepID=UPI003F745E2E
MLFPTLDFALFFVVVFALVWATGRHNEARKAILVVASYVFYMQWDWRFAGLLAGSSVMNWAAGLLIARADDMGRKKLILGIAVALNLAVLGFFKYYDFFIGSFNDMMADFGLERELPFMDIVLPVGISFFTFHGLSYIIDVKRGVIQARRSVLDLLLYISFFPQLVAGPIVRASHFLPQLDEAPSARNLPAAFAVLLILIGLFKKVVVADFLSTHLVEPAFFDPTVLGPVDLAFGVYGFAIQIWCDFSAYSDIAIGVAALLGYRFPLNFDRPYRSASLQEFWRRWHISLSTWLRDYLYVPLGGNRHGQVATMRNLMITMLLGGIWHGAAWTFVIWGLLHGTALVVERLFTARPAERPQPLVLKALAVIATFHFVCLTWIFFRAESLEAALTYIGAFANGEPVVLLTPYLAALVGAMLAVQFLPGGMTERVARPLAALPVWLLGLLAGAGIAVIDALGPEGIAPFIYFQF